MRRIGPVADAALSGVKPTSRLYVRRSWVFAPLSFGILWILGFGFLWWLLVPPVIYLSVRKRVAKPRSGAGPLLILGLWLLATLVGTVATGHASISRAAGAGFGALVWISAALLASAVYRADRPELLGFVKGVIWLSVAQGILALCAVVLHSSSLSSFSLVSKLVLGELDGVAPWTQANLAYDAYFGGLVIRSAGMMATAAWAGGFAGLMLIFLVLGRSSLRIAGVGPVLWCAAIVANLAMLYLSFSRVSWAICATVILARFLTWATAKVLGGTLFVWLVLGIAGVAGYAYLPWEEFLGDQDALRPGSSLTRSESYSDGIRFVTSQGPLVLLAGSGVKPLLTDGGLSAGSESTWVSLLVRGGLVAVALLALYILRMVLVAFRFRDWTTVALALALAIHGVVEDLDIGTLTLVVVFVSICLHRLSEISSATEGNALRAGA